MIPPRFLFFTLLIASVQFGGRGLAILALCIKKYYCMIFSTKLRYAVLQQMAQLRDKIGKLRDPSGDGLNKAVVHSHVIWCAYAGFHLADQKLQSLLVFLRGDKGTQCLKEKLSRRSLGCGCS